MATVKTPRFRVSYPSVLKPKLNDLNGKMEFSVVALFKKGEDLSKLEDEIKKVLEAKLGKDKSKWPKNIRSPFRDQAEREKEVEENGVTKMVMPEGYVKGAFFINLKSTHRPGVVDENVLPILDESDFYAGCYAQATINPFYYDQKGNRGISLGLQNIQKVADGEPLSGRTKAESDFAPVTDGAAKGASDLFT